MASGELPVCAHGVLISAMYCEACYGLGHGSWTPGTAPYSTSAPVFPTHVVAEALQGWECPKCRHVFAPFMVACTYCHGDQVFTNTSTGTAPQAG